MERSRLTSCCCTVTLALVGAGLGGCGGSANPLAVSGGPRHGRGVVDDPRRVHLACLLKLHVSLREVGTTNLLIGSPPRQAKVIFDPTPGSAQAAQIAGQTSGAEVIGSALLYPQQMSDSQLKPIEQCLAAEVKG